MKKPRETDPGAFEWAVIEEVPGKFRGLSIEAVIGRIQEKLRGFSAARGNGSDLALPRFRKIGQGVPDHVPKEDAAIL